jgi:hypothetical protein
MMKVGSVKEYVHIGQTRQKAVFYTYQDVDYDLDGWADAKKCLPEDFDLVYMRLKRERTIPGWVNGTKWHGLRLKSDDEVVLWKRKLEEKDT